MDGVTIKALEAGATSMFSALPEGLRKHREATTKREVLLTKKTSDVLTQAIADAADSGAVISQIASLRISGNVNLKHLGRLKGALSPSRLTLLDAQPNKIFDFIDTVYDDASSLDDLGVSGKLRGTQLPTAEELWNEAPNLTGLRLSSSERSEDLAGEAEAYVKDSRLRRVSLSAGSISESEAEQLMKASHSDMEYIQMSRIQPENQKFSLAPFVASNRQVFMFVGPVETLVAPMIDSTKTKNWRCGVLIYQQNNLDSDMVEGYDNYDMLDRLSKAKEYENLMAVRAAYSQQRTLSRSENSEILSALRDIFDNGSGTVGGCYTLNSFLARCKV